MAAPSPPGGALSNVRVIELGYNIAGAFAARLLGDFGADVVKLEEASRPDPARLRGPRIGSGSAASALFEFLNWNKRSVAVETGRNGGGELAKRLITAADVIIAGHDGQDAPGSRWQEAALGSAGPAAVIVQVSNFGQAGPYAAYEATDLVLQAMSGVMAISGSDRREPLRHGGRTSYYLAGLNAAYVALAGVFAARRTGVGVTVDMSIRDCLTSELVMNHAYHVFTGVVQGQSRNGGDPFDGHPVLTGDGYLALQTSARQTPDELAAFFGEPVLAEPRFNSAGERARNAADLRRILVRRLAGERALDVFIRASRLGLVTGVVQHAEQLLRCPQLCARELYTEFPEHGLNGRWRLPSVVAQLSRTPSSVRRQAPEAGAHTEELSREDGWRRASCAPLEPVLDATDKPLRGLRVLDLSVIFAVPYMGGLLADLGAEVIKIESPRRLDQTRDDWGGYFDNEPGVEPWNRSGTFQVINRGKRSLVLDLVAPTGRNLFLKLVARSDIVLNNFSPRVLPKLDLTYARLSEVNPRLVMLSNTGYGSTGPWATFKAQGTTLEATMGLMGLTGYEDGPPARAGQSVPDFIACWAGLVALLAALIHRQRTDEGQCVDIGMYQLGASVLPEALIAAQAGERPLARGAAHDLDADHAWLVRCDDGWLAAAVTDPAGLTALQRLLGVGGHEDDGLESRLRAWAGERNAADAAQLLQARHIAAGPVLDAAGLLQDPQLAARGFFESVQVEQLGEPRPLIGRPFCWNSTATHVGIEAGAPSFGADNEYVLCEVLGLTGAEAERLRRAGIVTDQPAQTNAVAPLDLPELRPTRQPISQETL